MYSKILDHVKKHLEREITVGPVTVGYFGDFMEMDLRRPGILIEPQKDSRAAKSTRWKDGSYQLRLWVMVEISRDYVISMRKLEEILETDDPNGQKIGVIAALNKLNYDLTFHTLTGKVGGKVWRINAAKAATLGDVSFGINQRANTKINTAQIQITIGTEVEK